MSNLVKFAAAIDVSLQLVRFTGSGVYKRWRDVHITQEYSAVRDAHGRDTRHAVQEVAVDVSDTASERESAELRQAVRRAAAKTQSTASRY